MYLGTNLAVRNGFGPTAVSGVGGHVIVVGSSDYARQRVLGLQWRHVFVTVIATATAVVDKNNLVIGGGTGGSRTIVNIAATATAYTVHRSPGRTRTGRPLRHNIAAGSGQPVLDPTVVGRQPVELSGAFLQKALGYRARFRWIAFRPEMVR